MIPTFKCAKRRKIYVISDSCESNSDMSLYKKSQIEMHKQVKRNLNKIFDEDSSQDENSSHNVQHVKQKDNEKSTNITERKDDISNKHTVNYQQYDAYSSSESDSDNIEISRQSRMKYVSNKKCVVKNFDPAEMPCTSSLSFIQKRKQVLKRCDNKRKNNKFEENTRHSQKGDLRTGLNSNSTTPSELNSTVVNTFVKQSKKENKKEKEQETVQNFKPYIIKVIERLQHMLSKYRLHINRLKTKFLKEDIVTLEDAEDITFIFNCIVNKLKKDLTEQEQDLNNSYSQWSMDNEQNRTTSNIQYKQYANNNNLQLQSERHIESSSDNELFSPSGSKNQSLKVSKNSKNNVQKNAKEAVVQQNIRNHTNEKSLKTKDILIHTTLSDNNNVTLQNNESVPPIYGKSNEVDLINTKDSTVDNNNTKTDKFSQNYTDKLEKPFNTEQGSSQHEPGVEIEIIDTDSELSNCSTMALTVCSSQGKNRQCIAKSRNNPKNTNNISTGEFHNVVPKIGDDNHTSRLNSSDSDHTVIISHNNSFQSNGYPRIRLKPFSALSNNENSNFQQHSNFKASGVNNLRSKYRFKPNFGIYRENFNSNTSEMKNVKGNKDKKLQMNCRVLINKCVN